MTTNEFVKLYLNLFAGTPDCYAIYQEWGEGDDKVKIYLPSTYSGDKEGSRRMVEDVVNDIGTSSYGEEAVTAHLMGKHFLGVYPIHSDSNVNFFALDFDKEEFTARQEARRQQEIFTREAGIRTYIERSRSGNGYHLWGFLSSPMHAGELRFALKPYIVNTDTYDRMFPNQDGNTEAKPYGNLIALPLYGKTVRDGKGAFVSVDLQDFSVFEIEDQKKFLAEIEKIPVEDLEILFEQRKKDYKPDLGGKIRTGDPEALDGIYKMLHPELGCPWVRWHWDCPEEVSEPEWHALACQFAQLNGGREKFHEFSARDPLRYDTKATDDKFDHALRTNAPHTCNYIRDNFAGDRCDCDERYGHLGVKHPYDLAKIPFSEMVQQLNLELDPEEAQYGVVRVVDHIKDVFRNPGKFDGFQYGIPALDKYTELRKNDLIICAARPGRGKTALMIDVAYRVALSGTPVYLFSMEMTRDQVWMRLLSRVAQVDGKRLQKGTLNKTEWRRILAAEKLINEKGLPIYVDDTTLDASEVVNTAAEMIGTHGHGLVMIDYLQMATNHQGESHYEKNSRVPREYKLLAKAMHVPVFVLAQMNREGEDLTEDSETLDTVLEGSGKIEQYADVILFVLGMRRPGIVRRVVVVHKERHREAGHRVKLDFNQPVMTFEPEGFWAMQAQQVMSAPQLKSVTPRDFFS